MRLPGGRRHDQQINKDKVLQLTGNYDRLVSLLTLPFPTGCFRRRRRRRRVRIDSTTASGQSASRPLVAPVKMTIDYTDYLRRVWCVLMCVCVC